MKITEEDLPLFSSLVEIAQYRALYQPNIKAFAFLADGKTESSILTYSELDLQSRIISSKLQSLTKVGDRVLLMYPPGLEFITAFLGCLYAGVVAVPVYPPKRNQHNQRLQSIADDAQTRIALSTTFILENSEKSLRKDPNLSSFNYLATDEIIHCQIDDKEPVSTSSDLLAFIQYTSGSTGTPKGVMVSHGNLIQNSEYIKQSFELTVDSVSVTWLPSFHDMGLIDGVIQPLYTGFLGVLMSPQSFVQKPIQWLQAITNYKATHSGGPNFGYEHCVRNITPEQMSEIDLRTWSSAYSGAEPIRKNTLTTFTMAFESAGFCPKSFYPCYGMAETTLMVSGGEINNPPVYCEVSTNALKNNIVVEGNELNENTQSLVSCGKVRLDMQVAIVNPESKIRCLPNEIGEIWVAGSSVAQGYWGKPEQTKQVFQAYSSDGGGPFLRTGDLGFLKNGEVFVTGRIKDVIIIRGRNHYPQDIELTVQNANCALRADAGAAFAIDLNGEERLVIVQEVQREYLRRLDVDLVENSIRQAVSEEHGLEVYGIVLLKTASIPKTSSGKIQRHACRDGFLAKTLNVVSESTNCLQLSPEIDDIKSSLDSLTDQLQSKISQATGVKSKNTKSATLQLEIFNIIQDWLITKVSQKSRIRPDQINIQEPFSSFGMDSIAAISIATDLEVLLKRNFPATLIYDYPTIQSLVHYIVNDSDCDIPSFSDKKNVDEDDVAIIGLGCRFPGAKDPQSFWQLLKEGKAAITEVPEARWDKDYQLEKNIQWGGFLENVDSFDAHFFRISPREAESMDPQQRLLMEVSWEALERAGQSPLGLAGSNTGVFIGISSNDYFRLQSKNDVGIDSYSGTGNAFSIAANRLSYFLDLKGPSWSVDTACSSSLVAIHQACQSLKNEECELALAGGVNLMLTPELTIIFSRADMIASDGRCKTFDSAADGYVRGEGCGIVVLKRLKDALRDGDDVLALIKGSSVNQDGRSNGLTAPNGPSQQAVISKALQNAGALPKQISYVESHGTGTSLGDPIEVSALKEVLMLNRNAEDKVWIGSVKTNIGHLESAAGVAGLIKVVLSLQNELIPAHLNFQHLNPYINLDNSSLSIPIQSQKWLRGKSPRLAGVSSFGFGGTNAHMILEESPSIPEKYLGDIENKEFVGEQQHLLVLSAHSKESLKSLAESYKIAFEINSKISISDICFTASVKRSHFRHRIAIVTGSIEQLHSQLSSFHSGDERAGLLYGNDNSIKEVNKKAFLFTGQGSQYVDMGSHLYESQPVFRKALDLCDEILRPFLRNSLLSVMYPSNKKESLIDDTEYAQAALFSIEYALFKLWESWGIKPDIVIGHSVGEYAAACVAGVFSLEDGLMLVAERGRLMKCLPSNGGMAVIYTDEKTTKSIIENNGLKIFISAVNGNKNTVVSGEIDSIKSAINLFKMQGFSSTQLNVSHAFHSPLMEPMVDIFRQKISQVGFSTPHTAIISNVTGELISAEIATANYWCSHILEPVKFSSSIEILCRKGFETFIEIGPKPVLLGMARNHLIGSRQNILFLPSLSSNSAIYSQMLQSLGELYLHNIFIDWPRVYETYKHRFVQIPTYPFQRKSYWLKNKPNKDKSNVSLFNTEVTNLLTQGGTKSIEKLLSLAGDHSGNSMSAAEALQALIECHQQQLIDDNDNNIGYQTKWFSQPRNSNENIENTIHSKSSSWMIFVDSGGVGISLQKLLQQRGEECILVYPASTFESLENGIWNIQCSNLGDWKRLFQEVNLTITNPLRTIVYLWSTDAFDLSSTNSVSIPYVNSLNCNSVLSLVKSLVELSQSPVKLWLVTRGNVRIEESSLPRVACASLSGLGSVIRLEHPELWGGMVDLPINALENESKLLLAEIYDSYGEDYLAFNKGLRYVPRLIYEQIPELVDSNLSWQCKDLNLEGNTYIVTGGLGAIGLEIIRFLLGEGATTIIIVSRHNPSLQEQQILTEMKEQQKEQVKLIFKQADVCCEKEMELIMNDIKILMPPLKGIVHAAGILDDGMLVDQDWLRFEKVLCPKVDGSWNLHNLTKELPLDFFVCFSSVASLIGSTGQSSYAAANAFMDALMHYRQSLGLSGLSINWGPWQLGMASAMNSHSKSRLQTKGISYISPVEGISILKRLLSQNITQIGILKVNWLEFERQFSHSYPIPSILKSLCNNDVEIVVTIKNELEKLHTLQPNECQEALVIYLQKQISSVLGIEQFDDVDSRQGFIDMGIDSLMAMELKNRLQKHFAYSFPTTLLFEYPSIQELSHYILDEIFSPSVSLDENKETLLSNEKVSVNELELLIATELAELEILLRNN